MQNGHRIALSLLAILACTSAQAQTGSQASGSQASGSQASSPAGGDVMTGDLPPVAGGSPHASIERAREEIASAAESLSGASEAEGEVSLTAAYRDVREAREAMQQAMTAARGEAGLPDEVSDQLRQAIDKTSDAVRILDEAASRLDVDAALSHLEDAVANLDWVSGRLER